ncbi:hypothetical protein [Burkholderia cenocepacia]|uniref:hypothetical protein n=1 Tax=Burkholderia cenocepacia TaxID=95486 RepID=UPI000D0C4EDC|nr:hypothetical protein [Burkholderia cenocepacia]SOT45867.1 hypothetical protein F01_550027 [Burkholderia cenocepacia]
MSNTIFPSESAPSHHNYYCLFSDLANISASHWPRRVAARHIRHVGRGPRRVLADGERLVEAEINPLFVLNAGQGVRAADGVAVIA